MATKSQCSRRGGGAPAICKTSSDEERRARIAYESCARKLRTRAHVLRDDVHAGGDFKIRKAATGGRSLCFGGCCPVQWAVAGFTAVLSLDRLGKLEER